MDKAQQRMQCMEVWGGNQSVDSGVVLAGLDAWVYSKPYGGSQGGGDVYYVSSCATGRINRLLIADVSGHGADVSDTAIELRTLMRRYVNYIHQGRFVREMNHHFTKLSQAGCFATAVVTTFFAPTNDLSLCNAGHPPPLLYRAATREWSFLEATDDANCDAGAAAMNLPLGVLDLESYGQFDVRLGIGDFVLCYTDSLIESRDPTGELLGKAGLLQIVRDVDASDPATLVPAILRAIADTAEGNLTADDVTVLLFRPNGMAPSVPLKDRLLAPLRVLRSIVGSLRPGGQVMALPEPSVANIGGAIIGPLSKLWSKRRREPGTTVIDMPRPSTSGL